jgi:hypothetical protein
MATPGPYGDCPLSSLLCRTLWKSYLFSCRTKLAKLLCLKCLGSMCLVNFSFCALVSDQSTGGAHSPWTYFEDDKAIAIVSPADHALVARTFQHPVPRSASSS